MVIKSPEKQHRVCTMERLARNPPSILHEIRHGGILPIDLPPFVFQFHESFHGHGRWQFRICKGEELPPIWIVAALLHRIHLHGIGIGVVSFQRANIEPERCSDPVVELWLWCLRRQCCSLHRCMAGLWGRNTEGKRPRCLYSLHGRRWIGCRDRQLTGRTVIWLGSVAGSRAQVFLETLGVFEESQDCTCMDPILSQFP